MAEVSTFRCDECGKLKDEANKWFRATKTDEPRFVIVPWDPAAILPAHYPVLHFCGMGCAVKAMTKAMEQSG
jgi:hypothetical protein